MKYEIVTRIQEEDVKKLATILKKEVIEIFADYYNPKEKSALKVIIKTKSKNILIENRCIDQIDKDEYFQLTIREYNGNMEKYEKLPFDRFKIEKISILHNKVSWKYRENEWNVDSDIKITFISEGEEKLYIQPIDSLAGFLLITEKRENLQTINEIWNFKTEARYISQSEENEEVLAE